MDRPLRIVLPRASRRSAPPPHAAGRDVGLLAFLLAVHAVPLLALAAGRSWGAATVGYATAVELLAGRELARELASGRRAGPRGGR